MYKSSIQTSEVCKNGYNALGSLVTLVADVRRFENLSQYNTMVIGGFFVRHRIVSAVVSNRMSYIVLRGRWCNLNVHVPGEEKSDDSKDSFMRN